MNICQMADPDHPYGYTNMRYVSSLISGVGIFCVGSGLSFYHGFLGIVDPQPLQDFFWVKYYSISIKFNIFLLNDHGSIIISGCQRLV